MAQYIDGLRAVWEQRHVAIVPIAYEKVQVHTISSHACMRTRETVNVLEDKVIADVGDGSYPAFTTLVATDIGLPQFKSATVKAQILDQDDRCRVFVSNSSYPMKYHFPIEEAKAGKDQ